MKAILIVLNKILIFSLINLNVFSQKTEQNVSIITDLTGNGIIRIQLLNDVPIQQMIMLNSCRYGKLNLTQVSQWKDLEKISIILNNRKLRNIEDVKFKKKKEVYFDFVVIMDFEGETFLILRQGDKKYLSKKVDPVFCPELDEVLNTKKDGC